jgi:hypothetical protein
LKQPDEIKNQVQKELSREKSPCDEIMTLGTTNMDYRDHHGPTCFQTSVVDLDLVGSGTLDQVGSKFGSGTL